MKRSKQTINILVVISTVFSLVMTAFAVNLPETSIDISEEKIQCNASIDEDFSDSRVLVVMSRDESCKLNDYTAADFPEVTVL